VFSFVSGLLSGAVVGSVVWVIDDKKQQRSALADAIGRDSLQVTVDLLRFGIYRGETGPKKIDVDKLCDYFSQVYKLEQSKPLPLTSGEWYATDVGVLAAISKLRLCVSEVYAMGHLMHKAHNRVWGVSVDIDEPYLIRAVNVASAFKHFLKDAPDDQVRHVCLGMARIFGAEEWKAVLEMLAWLQAYEQQYNPDKKARMEGVKGILFPQITPRRGFDYAPEAEMMYEGIRKYGTTQSAVATS